MEGKPGAQPAEDGIRLAGSLPLDLHLERVPARRLQDLRRRAAGRCRRVTARQVPCSIASAASSAAGMAEAVPQEPAVRCCGAARVSPIDRDDVLGADTPACG